MFHDSNDRISKINAIKHLESISEWKAAENCWRLIESDNEANVCLMIWESQVKGDLYREKVKKYMDWYDKTVENGVMTSTEALNIISPKLQKQYDFVYNPHIFPDNSENDDLPF